MRVLFKKIFSIFLLVAFFQSVVSLVPQLVSARQITLTVTETGIAGGRPAKLTAVVSSDDGTQKLSGIGGHFYFENPQNGQTCTNSGTTNAQGEVSGTCTSPQVGQVTIAYEPFDSEKKTVQTTFATAPAESGQYKVDLSNTNITFTNRVSTGYGVNAILKDKVSDQVISNQDGIEYNWTVDDSSIVKITGQGNPKGNVQLEGHKPGTTNLKIAVRKSGQTIAENSTPVTITQTTTGSSNYTAPAASPTPTPSPTVSPTPSATPTVTPTPKPSTSPTPKASASVSPSVSPSPSESPSESATPVASSSPAPSASPKPTAQKGSSFRFPIEMFLVVVGILAGIGIPLGWYYLDEHPEAKAKLLKKVEAWKTKFKKN